MNRFRKLMLYWKPLLAVLLIFLALLCCSFFMHEWLIRGKFPQGETVLLILAASFISCSATVLLGIGTGKAARQQAETQNALLRVQATMQAIAEDEKNVSQVNMAAPYVRDYLEAASLFVTQCFETYRLIKNSDEPDSKLLIILITQKTKFTVSAKMIEGLFSNTDDAYLLISKDICKSMDKLINHFGDTLTSGKLAPHAKACAIQSLFQNMKCEASLIEKNIENFSQSIGKWFGQNFRKA